jgi:hypothetical protein
MLVHRIRLVTAGFGPVVAIIFINRGNEYLLPPVTSKLVLKNSFSIPPIEIGFVI